MEDQELAKIRQQRMAQLQAASQMAGPGQGFMPGPDQAFMSGRPGGTNQGDMSKQQQQQQLQKEKEDEMKNSILSAVLTQEARARLATVAAAKPDRARLVENIIIQNTRMGGIRGKVDENSLKDLLEKVTNQTKRETKVSYERRRVFDDDDDDED